MMTDAPGRHVTTVLAAGGVVLDGPPKARRVLVVHRPAYDDWSLPKGHVDAGEDLAATALREVAEETDVIAIVERPVGTTEHALPPSASGRRKRVHWFLMRVDASAGDPPARAASRLPDTEVDVAEWWPVEIALRELTHANERVLLSDVVAPR